MLEKTDDHSKSEFRLPLTSRLPTTREKSPLYLFFKVTYALFVREYLSVLDSPLAELHLITELACSSFQKLAHGKKFTCVVVPKHFLS